MPKVTRSTARAKANKTRFLAALRATGGNVTRACAQIGLARHRPYDWAAEDPEFKAAWQQVDEEILDEIEEVARKLATGQYERPVVSHGRVVAQEPIYSERMIEMLLKAKRPEYRARAEVQHSGEVTLAGLLALAEKSGNGRGV